MKPNPIDAMTLGRVGTYEEALAVALIRNECREFMTKDTSVLDVERQLMFFKRYGTSRTLLLFIVHFHLVPVGYAIIKVEGRKACLTGGLAKPFRGHGLGKALFEYLLRAAIKAGLKPYLTVLRSNQRAVRLYFKLGFRITKATKRIYTMAYRP